MASRTVRHVGRQFKLLAIGVLVALVWMSGKASAAQCGSMAAGFETWKKQFAGEAQARVVSASIIAALMATTYLTATIAGQSKPLAIQKVARRPIDSLAILTAGVASIVIIINAVFLQSQRDTAPVPPDGRVPDR